MRPLVEEGLSHTRMAIEELRDLAHGIHPAILTRGGRGLAGLANRLAAVDGVLSVDSPPGAGIRISAEIPLPTPA